MNMQVTIICAWLIARLMTGVVHPHSSQDPSPDGAITNVITSHAVSRPSLGMCSFVKSIRPSLAKITCSSGKHQTATASVLALILCGDVQTNPGPNCNSIFPCGFCEYQVDFGMKAICCDNCDMWYHKSCASMSSTVYAELGSVEDWFCYKCHARNCDTFHAYEYSVFTRNSFSVLSTVDADDVFSSPLPQHPQAHSSPYGTVTTAAVHIPSYSSSFKSSTTTSASDTHDLPNKEENWRTLVVNVNSIFGKAAAFQHMISYVKPDAVIVTETKLNKDINTAEVFPSELGYTVYRRDRVGEGGGGVALLIKSCYASTEVASVSADPKCELIWVEVELRDKKKLLVSSFYRQPKEHTTSQLEALQSSLHPILETYRGFVPIIMGGDYNLPDISWDSICVKSESTRKSLHDYFLSLIQEFSLTQLVLQPTRLNNILDLFLTNSPNIVKSTHVIPGLSDHEAVVTDCNILPRHVKKPPHKVHLYSKADWSKIKEEAQKFCDNYLNTMTDLPLGEKWTAFRDKINSIVDNFIPSKMSSTRYNVPWLTTSMKRLSRKKKRLYKKAKKSHGKQKDTIWARYRSCKSTFNKGMKEAKEHFISNIITDAFQDNNTKPFWKFVKSKRSDNTGIPPLKEDGRLYSDSKSKADILNRQFTSVFTREDTSNIPTPTGPPQPSMPDIEVEVRGVQKLLSNIKPNKASGPDGIPCRILKETATEIAPILTDIFNTSLAQGTLPAEWKKANVAPVFKKGNTNSAENYRPISLTCVCCKLLEHIICHSIRAHLENHNILSVFQHGFRSGHSCESQLLSTVYDLLTIFDRKKQVDVAVLDFSKAFDVVPHKRLLGKLQHCGINRVTLDWIGDFLSGRTQRVVVDGSHSPWSPVHSGVPQGTVLGPLLFLIYINDLPDCVSSKVRLFADDCLVYREIGCLEDQLALQRDLDALEAWASRWGMKFNPSKCVILSISRSTPLFKIYSLCGTPLQHVSEAKYLGVTLSNDLQWNKHIQSLSSKASSTLGLLRRNLHGCPTKLREQAYVSLIRSKVEYCSAIWDPYLIKDINTIEAIQRRAARFVVQDYSRYTSVTNILKDLDWKPLKDRRRDIRLTLLYKIVTGKVAVQAEGALLPADSRTRHINSKTYRHLRAKTTEFKNSFFTRTLPEWNNLPEACVEADTTTAFQTQLRRTP